MSKAFVVLNLKVMAQMTPTAAKLYELTAVPEKSGAASLDTLRQICGLPEGSIAAWAHEVERACREVVSSGVVAAAWMDAGFFHFTPKS